MGLRGGEGVAVRVGEKMTKKRKGIDNEVGTMYKKETERKNGRMAEGRV